MSGSGCSNGELFSFHKSDIHGADIAECNHWHVLAVDVEQKRHSVFQSALSDLIFQGKKLKFHWVFSIEDALVTIRNAGSDFALVVLDGSLDKGSDAYQVVSVLREEQGNAATRILVYTGEFDPLPDHRLIEKYDISDYKNNIELTPDKLRFTAMAALRSYVQIEAINQHFLGLEKIIESSSHLLNERSIKGFSEGVIMQISALLGIPADGLVCAKVGSVLDKDDQGVYVLGAAGKFSACVSERLENMTNDQIVTRIYDCLGQHKHIFGVNFSVLYLKNVNYEAAVYVALGTAINASHVRIIETFLSCVSTSYENVDSFYHLRSAAYTDWLTRLPNRNEFLNLLEQASADKTNNVVVALIDINHFSDVNDGLGQDAGNNLLVAIARRLDEDFSGIANVGRIGADVFGLVGCESVVNPTSINASFVTPFEAGEHLLPTEVSIGLYKLLNDKENSNDILKKTNIALNQAKKSLTANYDHYQPEMEQQTTQRLIMIRKLREDFADRKLEVWYQPQIDLVSKKVIGMEALLRWPDGQGGYVSPAIFVPLAEYSGLIVEMGAWVLEESCRALKFLQLENTQDLRIAVNISMPQFRDANFIASVKDAVLNNDIEPASLELEITESVVMDEPQIVIDTLKSLKSFGVQIAIDDFGTGFSSMSYLQQLPFDRMKVDRSFISDPSGSKSAFIAETIVSLGNRLGMQTIAEGIESPEQAGFVLELGCDEAQGFLFAKPMPFDDLLIFLNS